MTPDGLIHILTDSRWPRCKLAQERYRQTVARLSRFAQDGILDPDMAARAFRSNVRDAARLVGGCSARVHAETARRLVAMLTQ